MAAAEDIAKVLTAIGASGLATIVTAITTVIISGRNLAHRREEKEADEASKDWLRHRLEEKEREGKDDD